MSTEDILKGLYDETLVGNGPRVLELTRQGLDEGMTPESTLFDALIPSLEEVGARFERGVMVGGAPVTQEYADAVGADGYAADASTAVRKAKELLAARRAAVGV